MDGRPPPAPPPQDNTTTPKPTRRSPNEDLAARTAPQPSGHPNPPQASSQQRQPTAGNNNRSQRENSQSEMEAFIRQWGASTNDISDFSLSPGLGGWASTSSGFDLVGSRTQSSIIRADRSASFDNNESDANNNVGRSNTSTAGGAAGQQPNNVQRCATFDNGSQHHRRISSTGDNNRQQTISSTNNSTSIPQHLFDGLVLGGATDDNDPTNNTTNSTMDNILNGGMSALHDAARITDWDSVAALSTSNPESAKYVGPDGWNALHHACDRRCPHVDVIDLLLNAHPEAIIQTNDKGWTPLHRACRNKTSKDVVKLLLNKYIELGNRAASMRCNDGRSALHYALLYDAPEGVVDLLLAADPQAVLDEDRDGVSPLGTVWDKYANTFEGRRMLQVLLKQFDGEGWELGSSSAGGSGSSSTQDVYNREQLEARQQKNHKQASEEETAERIKAAEKRARDAMEKTSPACKVLQTNWNKANTLLRAYFRFPLQQEEESTDDDGITTPKSTTAENTTKTTTTRKRKWRILHAVSSIKCHPKLFLLARALHPEQALEIDENDLYANGRATGERSSSSLSDPQSSQLSERTALHFAAMSPLTGKEGRNVVKVLLKLNPSAASHVDGYGSLPLHLICENVRRLHWTNFGPLDIYNTYPEATSCIDGSGKTPLHCASASSGQYMSFYPRPVSAAGLPVVSEEESVIRNLVEANGTAASIADNTGRLPLHYIAERLENWSADVQAVLDAHPNAAQTRAGPSTSNQLPLHMAASSPDARPPLIMGILGANPRAASIVDGKGRLPLHLVVDSGRTTWDNGIASIYMAYTPAISKLEESPRRWTILHAAAASKSAGCDLIKAIISLAKNTASVQDSDGRYPLHLACASNRSWEDGGMKDIFDADPSAALSEDVHGLLPFHIAAMRGSTTPSATTNSSTPSSAAAVESEQADNDDLESLEVLFVLLRSQPSIVQL